ncbi:MAG: tRNA pseudouridine(38-40) synthase TruA [Acidobacteriota bacterium]
MPRFILAIEYAGTRYSGWQIQKNARTVAGEIERAVHAATGAKTFELYGAGRTDAGVHAMAQVAHLQLDTRTDEATLVATINDELPSDINIVELVRAPQRFHARHDAVARSYVYQISRRRTAFGKPFVWWVRDRLDVDAMRRASEHFVGMKDFQSFAVRDDEDRSTKVQVDGVEIVEREPLVLIRMAGSHFLWRMVRRVVGVLVEVGRRKLRADDILGILDGPSEVPARLTAPPSGLFLERVFYRGDAPASPLEPMVFGASRHTLSPDRGQRAR